MTMHDALVDTAWVAEHANDPKVCLIEIDWTGREAYDAGHIPGALGWNWKEFLWDADTREFPDPQEFARRLGAAGISNDTTVVFCGAPVQFGTYGWWVFKYCGHRDVRMLDGGRVRWQKDGRPFVTDIPEVQPAHYAPVERVESMRAGRDLVMDALNQSDTVILDHRSPEEFTGDLVGVPGHPDVGAERYGRIPGARHIPFNALLDDDETFKSEAELRPILEAAGAGADIDIISYCRLSHRATLAYFAMTQLLGYDNVRTYDGSWTEWGSLVGVPIER